MPTGVGGGHNADCVFEICLWEMGRGFVNFIFDTLSGVYSFICAGEVRN